MGLLDIQGGQSFPEGILGKFGDAMKVQLVHELLAVRLYGLDADVKDARDLLRTLSLGKELEHLTLPRRKEGRHTG